MATTSTSTSKSAVAAIAELVFTSQERLALAGFLAGYTGLTARPTRWTCGSTPPGATSATSARSRPAALASSASPVTWKPKAGPGQRSPAGCVRSPDSTGTRWKKTCLTILRPLTSGVPGWTTTRTPPGWTATNSARCWSPRALGQHKEHALISLLALNGLRVSEATGANIEALGTERGHRTLTITRKGGKVVTVPLAPRTSRAIDLAIRERCEGPVFLIPDGRRLDRHGAARIVRRVARRAGITKIVGPHTLRHAFITPRWMLACRCVTCRKPPPTLTRARRSATTAAGPHSTGTPPS
jgi:Phage integrase family